MKVELKKSKGAEPIETMAERDPSDPEHPLMALDPEDREFVLRFVLASGSLKDVAALYGVSYPTIRARLDRVIERLKTLQAGRTLDPMADMLAEMIEKGQIGSSSARRILDLHRDRLRQQGDHPS